MWSKHSAVPIPLSLSLSLSLSVCLASICLRPRNSLSGVSVCYLAIHPSKLIQLLRNTIVNPGWHLAFSFYLSWCWTWIPQPTQCRRPQRLGCRTPRRWVHLGNSQQEPQRTQPAFYPCSTAMNCVLLTSIHGLTVPRNHTHTPLVQQSWGCQ